MGVSPASYAILNTAIGLERPKRICEFGNQHFHGPNQTLAMYGKSHVVKDWIKGLGIEHVSIDTNGQDGALPLDLSKPLPIDLDFFDLVTNFGTIEHIEDDAAAFANMDRLCRPGGLMIHVAPLEGHWPGHGLHYYTAEWFRDFAIQRGYAIVAIWVDIDCGEGRYQVAAILKKKA